jgi:hypothetical protein
MFRAFAVLGWVPSFCSVPTVSTCFRCLSHYVGEFPVSRSALKYAWTPFFHMHIYHSHLPLIGHCCSAHDKLIVNKRPINCRMLPCPWNRGRLKNWTCPAVRVGNVQGWLPWFELVLESCNMGILVKVSRIPLTERVGSKGEVHSIIGHEATEGSRAAVLNPRFTDPPSVDRLLGGGVHEFRWRKTLHLYFHKSLTDIKRFIQ